MVIYFHRLKIIKITCDIVKDITLAASTQYYIDTQRRKSKGNQTSLHNCSTTGVLLFQFINSSNPPEGLKNVTDVTSFLLQHVHGNISHL